MFKKNQLYEDCPKNCSCKWHGMDMVRDTNPMHTVQVDCSNKQLINLPENLPENTVLLNITNNKVKYMSFLYINI